MEQRNETALDGPYVGDDDIPPDQEDPLADRINASGSALPLYGSVVAYLVAHGWRREGPGDGWWWRDGFEEGTLGQALDVQLEADGIDTRKMFADEPQEFWNEIDRVEL